MSTSTTTITSDAVISSPHTFSYASAETVSDTSATLKVNFDTIAPKLKHLCNHTLSSGQYRLANCPRCLGTGYYYDIKFNDVGNIIQVDLKEKLAQQLEKLVITEENRFHSEVALNIKKWLGSSPISEIKAALKFELIKSLMSFQEIQKGAPGLTGYDQIGRIDNVSVYEDTTEPDKLFYIIQLTTISGLRKELSGTIV